MKTKTIKVIIAVFLLLNCKQSYSALQGQVNATTENTKVITQDISTNQKKFNIILDYEMSRRRNVFTSVLLDLNYFWNIVFFFAFIIYPNMADTYLAHYIFITLGSYGLLRVITGIINMIIKRGFIHNYSSYKNGLTNKEIIILQERLHKAVKEEELKGMLIKFINIKNVNKINICNLDPIQIILSIWIGKEKTEKYNRIRKKENEEIIEGIVENYKFDIKEQLITISWFLMNINLVKTISFYIMMGPGVMNIDIWTFVLAGIPMILSILEFAQIGINKNYYNKFINDLQS